MLKKLLFIFCFICLISNGFSYVNVSSCQNINDASLDIDREIRLNQSLFNISSSFCFYLTNSNYVFDCQNNIISGDGGDAFNIRNVHNITVKNCIMDNQMIHLEGFTAFVNNSNFINLTINNVPLYNSGIYFKETNVKNNFFSNLEITGDGNCISIEDGNNNLVIGSTFNCTDRDVTFSQAASYNIFRNNLFLGTGNHINLNPGSNVMLENIFYENTFTNISSIISDDWSLSPTNFSYLGVGNTYIVNNSFTGIHCFDEPINNSCDLFPLVFLSEVLESSGSVSVSSLPSFGVWSVLVSLFGIFIFLL
jgi:hypothetical protein